MICHWWEGTVLANRSRCLWWLSLVEIWHWALFEKAERKQGTGWELKHAHHRDPLLKLSFWFKGYPRGMRKWRVTKMKRKSSLVTCVWQKCLYRIWFEIYIDASSYDTTVTSSSLNWTWNNNGKQPEWQFSYSAVRFFISQFCNISSVHSARWMCFCYYDFSAWLGAALLKARGRVSKLSI